MSTELPVLCNLRGVVVVISGDEPAGDRPAFGGEDGDGDGKDRDAEQIYPKYNFFLLGQVDISLHVHLRFMFAAFLLF